VKKLGFVIAALVIILAGCQSGQVIDNSKLLDPVGKDAKLPEIVTPVAATIPFKPNDVWASQLSKFVPVYENPEFMPADQLGKPDIYQNQLTSQATDINAQTFHKGSPRDIFEWFDKNYQGYGYKLDTAADRDPKVYIVVDEHGYFILSDGKKSIEIHVWNLNAYPGWTKVTYEGSVFKDCGCSKK